jgi:hypothetical protein
MTITASNEVNVVQDEQSHDNLPTTELLGVLGSTAYGMSTASSDVDRIGVFVAPTRDVLSLRGGLVCDQTHVRHDPDIALHEIGKFLRLGLKANPTILELLYVTNYDRCTSIGEGLVSMRSHLLCEDRVRGAYVGYVQSQLGRIARKSQEVGDEAQALVTRKRIAKHARHCFRLLRSGAQLLSSGEIVLDVGDDRDEIFAAGELALSDPTGFSELVTARIAELDAMKSCLPKLPNYRAVNEFVVATRMSLL